MESTTSIRFSPRPIALEIKKARGKPTPLQILRLQDLRDAGCYAWIIRSPYDALEAVYWVVKGWTRPLSSEPLDLNAWLTGSPPRVEAEPFEPAAKAAPPSPDVDSFNFEPLSSPYTEAHHHAVEVVMGGTQADAPREPALPHQGGWGRYRCREWRP